MCRAGKKDHAFSVLTTSQTRKEGQRSNLRQATATPLRCLSSACPLAARQPVQPAANC